jgi:hypothetical protein
MSKLSLSNWASIAEIATSIVVVVSLVVIGVELRQNTSALHNNSWQAVNDKLIDLDIAETASPGLSTLIKIGESTPEELNGDEWWRFSRIAMARLGQIEYAFLAVNSGALGDYHWSAVEGYLGNTICRPGYRRFWAEFGDVAYHPDFTSYVGDEVLPACESQ